MCVVVQRHLGKGGPLARLPLHPSRQWRSSGIKPSRAIETGSRFIAGQGAGPRHPPFRRASALSRNPHGKRLSV
jgi:hypothetical protein